MTEKPHITRIPYIKKDTHSVEVLVDQNYTERLIENYFNNEGCKEVGNSCDPYFQYTLKKIIPRDD